MDMAQHQQQRRVGVAAAAMRLSSSSSSSSSSSFPATAAASNSTNSTSNSRLLTRSPPSLRTPSLLLLLCTLCTLFAPFLPHIAQPALANIQITAYSDPLGCRGDQVFTETQTDHCFAVDPVSSSYSTYFTAACTGRSDAQSLLLLGYRTAGCTARPWVVITSFRPFSDGACVLLNSTTANSTSSSYARVSCNISSDTFSPGIVAAIIIGTIIVGAFACFLLASFLGLPCIPKSMLFSCCSKSLAKITPNTSLANGGGTNNSRR